MKANSNEANGEHDAPTGAQSIPDKTAFRYLLTAVLFDRIGYHGMLALLIFYLSEGKEISPAQAAAIFGGLGALVYAATPLGATLSDLVLGLRRSTLGGAWIGLLGLLLITLDSTSLLPMFGELPLYFGLGCVAVGIGIMHPAVSVLVGELASRSDNRREEAYSVFWMIMNIGVLIGPLVCGWLGQAIDWTLGFSACAAAMALALLFFHLSATRVPEIEQAEHLRLLRHRVLPGIRVMHLVVIAVFMAVLAIRFLLQNTQYVPAVLSIVFTGAIGSYVFYAFRRCTPGERSRALICLAIAGFSFVFLVLLNQYGTALAFFAARHVNLEWLGLTFQPSQVVSFQPAFLVLLMPAVLAGWAALDRRGHPVTALAKMAFGLALLGIAFGWLAYGARFGNAEGGLHLNWMISFYLVMAISEILVAPIGLSFTTRLAVPRIVGLTVAIWMLSWSAASYVAALGGGWAASVSPGDDPSQSLDRFVFYFSILATVGLLVAVLLLVVSPALQRRVRAAFADSGA